MLGCAVDEEEDEGRQELVSTGRHLLGVPEGRHEVGGALGDAMQLVLRGFF